MKVVICGGGQVGFNIARYLASEQNDVTVIDQQQELVNRINDTLDVQGICGFASHPDVLDRAGAADADLLVAVTYADEVNMVACQVAHSLFDVPKKIARVRNQKYLQPIYKDLFSHNHLPIDVIISPEIEVARAIARRLQVPGAFDITSIADGRIKLVGVIATENCPIINTPLRHLTGLFPDLSIEIIGIMRGDRPIIPDADDQMLPGDEVYFVVDSRHLQRAMAAFGHDRPRTRNVIVVGGGNIGMFLAHEARAMDPDLSIRLIEMDRARAENLARSIPGLIVLHGDGLDHEILEEANVLSAEAVVAVTDDDEGNILASLLAKRTGAQRAITLVNRSSLGPLVTNLGIDAVVSPRAITVSSILQHVRRGRIRSVNSVLESTAEVLEIEALDTSQVVGKALRDIDFPHGIIVGAIVRGEQVIMPRPETAVQAGDRVIIAAVHDRVPEVERMFTVRLEFFG